MSKFSRDLLEYSLYGPLSRQKEDPTALQENPCRNRMNWPAFRSFWGPRPALSQRALISSTDRGGPAKKR
jgi:hypothetical protein